MGAQCSSNQVFPDPTETHQNDQGNEGNDDPQDTSSRDPYTAFDEFLEANCVTGNDKHVHLQELEAAFAFFLRARGWQSTLPGIVAHEFVLPMCLSRGFQTSPGFRHESLKIDTRHIVGVSVVRFQKA